MVTWKPLLYVAIAACFTSVSSAGADIWPDPEMISVPAGTFVMGMREGELGSPDELPRHEVTLPAYAIAKYEVTNGDYARVLNWAQREGYIKNAPGPVHYNGRILKVIEGNSEIMYINGIYMTMIRDEHPVADHPVADVTWHGAVAYANWLSEMHGLEPCYDLRTWKPIEPVPNGYRLPTEAEWERAAGWDLSGPEPKRWLYGFQSDTLDDARINYDFNNPMEPQGMLSSPKTSPVGYFNGENPGTVDSPSPVGCYDMSGNVYEWVSDWFDQYGPRAQSDPKGPATGVNSFSRGALRVLRGGGWGSHPLACRVSNRAFIEPSVAFGFYGFRLARNATGTVKE